MKREEAKRRIECCRDFLANNYSDMGEPNFTAFNMAIEALDAVSIPEGATNGDVFKIMFNKTFPKTIILYKNDESRLTINPMFTRDWWEMPYKESEV